MQIVGSSFNYVSTTLESGKNYGVRQLKKVVSPATGPIIHVSNIINKTLTLANYVKCDSLLPIFARSLVGFNEILGIGGFLSQVCAFVPVVNEDNLDEEVLKESLDFSTYPLPDAVREKWVKRIVKQVKVLLNKTSTEAALRKELEEYLVNKGLDANFAARISQFSEHEKSMVIKQKDKYLIEKIYQRLFLVSSFSKFYSTLENWQVIQFTESLTTKLGKVPLLSKVTSVGLRSISYYSLMITVTLKLGHNGYKLYQAQVKVWQADLSELAKSKEARTKEIWNASISLLTFVGIAVLFKVSSVGLRSISYYSVMIAVTLKLGHNGYKLYQAQVKVWQADPSELAKSKEARTKEIWNASISLLTFVGIVVPLVIAVNTGALLAFEIFAALASLANALRG
jgi:hypothetical protein